jgi:uncharacterized protein YjbI with pentapeptide repeats
MDTDEFIRKYAGEGRDFTGRRFGGERNDENFRGIYREANFANTIFDGCDFRESDLSFAKFKRVRLYETTFNDCLMEEADFSYAYFGQAGFRSVDLRGAIFRNANFIEGSFGDTVLSYADLTGAKNLIEASYVNVIFYETIMPNGQIYTGRTNRY